MVNFINIDDEKIELKINKKYKSESGIPEYLYYVTHPIYTEEIGKKVQLLNNFSDRIYFTHNINDAVKFAKYKYMITNNDDFCDYIILEIDTKKLNNIKLINDPLKVPNILMSYTDSSIPIYMIRITEEKSLKEYRRYVKIKSIKKELSHIKI